MKPPEVAQYSDDLKGLARKCPKCKIIGHYDVKGRKPIIVDCPCGYSFSVQKFKRGERPKAIPCILKNYYENPEGTNEK